MISENLIETTINNTLKDDKFDCPFSTCSKAVKGLESHILKQHIFNNSYLHQSSATLKLDLQNLSRFLMTSKPRKWFCCDCKSFKKIDLSTGPSTCNCQTTFDINIMPSLIYFGANSKLKEIYLASDPSQLLSGESVTFGGTSLSDDEIISKLTVLYKSNIQTIESIPKSCFHLFGLAVKMNLQRAINKNDAISFLFKEAFPKCVLNVVQVSVEEIKSNPRLKTKEGRKKLQEKQLSTQLKNWLDSNDHSKIRIIQNIIQSESAYLVTQMNNTTNVTANNIKACIKDVAIGKFSNAIRRLESNGVHTDSKEVLDQLKRKHPGPESPVKVPDPNWKFDGNEITIQKSEMKMFMTSFSKDTACGKDGFHAQYYQDLTNIKSENLLNEILDLLSKYHSNCLMGILPKVFAPLIGSAKLIPLIKPDYGVRPIAVGCIDRRLTSKIAVKLVMEKVQPYLKDGNQMGVGVKGGMEASILALKEFVKRYGDDSSYCCLKVDAMNAFNIVNRSKIFEAVTKQCPLIRGWVEYIYESEPILFTSSSSLKSRTGVQQGDPLGPLLFSICIHPLVLKAKEINPGLNIWYLDDGNFMGKVNHVAQVANYLDLNGPEYGFYLEKSKSSIWWPTPDTEHWTREFGNDYAFNLESGMEFLGCPIGDTTFIESWCEKKYEECCNTLDLIDSIKHSQSQLLLLRATAGYCKIVHLMRTIYSPIITQFLKKFDERVDTSLKNILGITNQSFREEDRLRCHLSCKIGGLGIQKSAWKSSACFIAGRLHTLPLQTLLLEYDDNEVLLKDIQKEYDLLFLHIEQKPLINTLLASTKPQSLLSDAVDLSLQKRLVTLINTTPRKLRSFTAASTDSSGTWLRALPKKDLKFYFSDEEFSSILRKHLDIPIYPFSKSCKYCNSSMDIYGDHSLNCKKRTEQTSVYQRHNQICAVLERIGKEAGLPVIREAQCISGEGIRPGDVFFPEIGRGTAVDCTVADLFQELHKPASVVNHSTILEKRSKEKLTKYLDKCEAEGIDFVEFVVHTNGGLHSKALELLKLLAIPWSKNRGIPVSSAVFQIKQRIEVALKLSQSKSLVDRMSVLNEDLSYWDFESDVEIPVEFCEEEVWINTNSNQSLIRDHLLGTGPSSSCS